MMRRHAPLVAHETLDGVPKRKLMQQRRQTQQNGLSSSRKLMQLRAQAMAIPIQPRLCKEANLSYRLVASLNNVGPHETWLELWPRHAMHCAAAANAAVAALTKALEYNKGGRTASEMAVAAFATHGNALELLRAELESIRPHTNLDSALVCIAALAVFQVIMNDSSKGRRADTFAHWAGVHAITQARQVDHCESDIVRAILYSFSDGLSGIAVLRGTPLVLEQQYWADIQPASLHPMPSDLLKLRATEYRLQIQLPHLISKTRAIRETTAITFEDLNAIYETALRLYQTADDEDETAILRRTTVVKAEVDSIVPVTLKFATNDDMLVALAYWHNRLVVVNCCIRMVVEGYSPPGLDLVQLRADRDRLYMNVLMSWEHAALKDSFAAAIAAKGLTQGWQHLRTCETWRGLRCDAVIQWVLPRLASPSLAYLEAPALTIAQLDTAADMLQGGPLGSFLSSEEHLG